MWLYQIVHRATDFSFEWHLKDEKGNFTKSHRCCETMYVVAACFRSQWHKQSSSSRTWSERRFSIQHPFCGFFPLSRDWMERRAITVWSCCWWAWPAACGWSSCVVLYKWPEKFLQFFFFHLESGFLVWLQSVTQHLGLRLLLYQKQQDNNVLGVESEDEVTPICTCWCTTEAEWCLNVVGPLSTRRLLSCFLKLASKSDMKNTQNGGVCRSMDWMQHCGGKWKGFWEYLAPCATSEVITLGEN